MRYIRSEYNNPYQYHNKPKPKKKVEFKKFVLSAILLGWIGLLVYLPYFRITKINYFGLNIIKPTELDQTLKQNYFKDNRFWPHNNYFLTKEANVANLLQNSFSLNSIEVKKIFPHQINITVEEKITSVVYDNGQKYFLLDQTGTAVKYLKAVGDAEYQISQTVTSTTSTIFQTDSHQPNFFSIFSEYGRYPIVYDTRHKEIFEKQSDVLHANYLKGILDFYNGLEKGSTTVVNYMEMGEPAAGVTVYTNKAYKIIFQPLNDIPSQLGNLATILKDNKPTDHIDLRFAERVYWK